MRPTNTVECTDETGTAAESRTTLGRNVAARGGCALPSELLRARSALTLLAATAACGRVEFTSLPPREVPHVPGLVASGTEQLAIRAQIDTDRLEVDGVAARFTVVAQPAGPELAVLEAATIWVPDDAVVTVVGARALVIVATTTIQIDGTLDAGAVGALAGPGASSVDGAGLVGSKDGVCDRGGGGAGHATAGASGGAATECDTSRTQGGPAFGDPDISVLVGGGRGGDGASGANCGGGEGGGGGGALQLSAGFLLEIAGTVISGGGGGGGGLECAVGDAGSGGGGGAGGAIVLDAARVVIAGQVAALGGGGGSGGNGNDTLGVVGNGAAGTDAGIGPGRGGGSLATNAGAGGDGGGLDAPGAGGDVIHNGGGGGGSVGRIVILGELDLLGTARP